MRVTGAGLGARVFLDIRDTRRRLGRSLRVARHRRANGGQVAASAVAVPAAVVASQGLRRRRLAIAIVALLIAGLLLTFLIWSRPHAEEEPGGGLPALRQPQPEVVQHEILRGKSIALALPSPTAVPPEPTTVPPESPSATPARAAAGNPGGVAGGTGAGTGGSGTGTGAGAGAGSGSGTRTPTPPPAPTPLGALNPTYGRFSILVVDDRSGAPLADVCLIVGSGGCGPTKPHTDANGRWTTDVPLATPTLLWDIQVIKAGYNTEFRRFTLRQGQTVTYVVRLVDFQPRD